jgi:hypothetical protein
MMNTEWKGIIINIYTSIIILLLRVPMILKLHNLLYYAVLGPVLVIVISVVSSISASLIFISYCYIRYRAKLRSLGKLFNSMH